MKRKTKRTGCIALALLFSAGAVLFLFPILTEISSYRTDESEYEAMAEQVRPPESASTPALPIATPFLVSTEEPSAYETSFFSPAWDVTEQPTAAPSITPMPSEAVEASMVPATAAPTVVSTMPSEGKATATPAISQNVQSTRAPAGVDLTACLNQNKDFVAWLTIPGTKIDYPVVRSDNTAYYLTHLFSGKESKLGCLFSLKSSDYQTPSKNIAIYGHHLSSSDAMFSTLMSYKSASYCSRHSTIRLDSLYGTRSYRIFAVFNMTVTDWDASTASFPSNESFLRFVNHAQGLSLYDTGVQVSAEDHILTLITCDRSFGGADGRLIVMAVQE